MVPVPAPCIPADAVPARDTMGESTKGSGKGKASSSGSQGGVSSAGTRFRERLLQRLSANPGSIALDLHRQMVSAVPAISATEALMAPLPSWGGAKAVQSAVPQQAHPLST